jgi:hypothetical protein
MAHPPRVGTPPSYDFGSDHLPPLKRRPESVDTRWFDLGFDALEDVPTLAQLLPQQDLQASINAAIRPQGIDPLLLTPVRFVDTLQAARDSLAVQAQRRLGDGTSRCAILQKAVTLLKDHDALCAMVRTNRLALFQG